MGSQREDLVETLAEAGFVAAGEEADELIATAGADAGLLASSVVRRLTGEPLAWITGSVSFCGSTVVVHPGVYVPRFHSEALARRAVALLPATGRAVDLCTGSGAIAAVLSTTRPAAQVVATDVDARAVVCARANGIDAYHGDLFDPLPGALEGRVDVVVGVVPYVPTAALGLLQRDTLTFEPVRSYDGGPAGTDILSRALEGSRRFLRPGGALLLELGGDQADAVAADLARLGFTGTGLLVDEEGDTRGIEAILQDTGATDRSVAQPVTNHRGGSAR